jgi:hypothetical protein
LTVRGNQKGARKGTPLLALEPVAGLTVRGNQKGARKGTPLQ